MSLHRSTRRAARSRAVLRSLIALAIAAPTLASAQGTPPPEQLAPVAVTATRTPAAPPTIGSAVDVLSPAELTRQQITTLDDALGGLAGAPLFTSGAPGAATSLFLRGANSNQVLFLVDGIRLNDPNTDYQVFLGGASLGAADTLEVVRGPQSTLYGGEAIGGVVALRAARGSGAPSASLAFEGGSFGTVSGAIAAQGESGANAYNFSARGGHTDNARPNNFFDSANAALRLDRRINDRVALGGTVRWFHGDFGSPGDRFTNDPNNEESESNLLATAFADAKLDAAWALHATLGGQDRRYVANSPAPNPPYYFPSDKTIITNRRAVFDAQSIFTGLERHRVLAGFTAEANRTRNTGFGAVNKKQGLFAVFAQDEFSPRDDLFFTAGLRDDDFDTFGRATTGRATAAWLVAQRALKLRASYGTGFRSPSFLDLYGRSAFYVGNRNLKAESSRGWDAGMDFYLPDRRGTLSATWFQSNVTNLIDYNFAVFPGTVMNVGRARMSGVELAAHVNLPGAVQASASYTYLDAERLLPTAHVRLLRRPRQQYSADASRDFGAGFTAGAGVRVVTRRRDIDPQTFAVIDAPDFAVARIYAAWQATPRFAVKARVENALDRKYEPVTGYPAPGIGAFGGVEWKF